MGLWELDKSLPHFFSQKMFVKKDEGDSASQMELGWMEAADNLQASHSLLMGAAGLTE